MSTSTGNILLGLLYISIPWYVLTLEAILICKGHSIQASTAVALVYMLLILFIYLPNSRRIWSGPMHVMIICMVTCIIIIYILHTETDQISKELPNCTLPVSALNFKQTTRILLFPMIVSWLWVCFLMPRRYNYANERTDEDDVVAQIHPDSRQSVELLPTSPLPNW